jgi:hypothetical protein
MTIKQVNTGDKTMRNEHSEHPANPKIGVIGVQTILAAALALAITFTLSCSSGDDPSEGNGQGASFNENSQIYNIDGTLYKGSGDIKMQMYNEDGKKTLTNINAGNVTNGIVNLNLLQTIPDEYLMDINGFSKCPDNPQGIKVFSAEFALINSNGDYIGYLGIIYDDEQLNEGIYYTYFSKAGKITCNYDNDGYKYIINIDAKAGWNKIYIRDKNTDEIYTNGIIEQSTSNILTVEMKWIFIP